jgi:hypothetical protein
MGVWQAALTHPRLVLLTQRRDTSVPEEDYVSEWKACSPRESDRRRRPDGS